MLAAIDVRLYSENDCILPHPCAHMLHAVVLDMVRRMSPEAAEELHRESQVKPFSLSTLWPRKGAKGDSLLIPPYTECRFRLCTANRQTFETFGRPLFAAIAQGASLQIGPYAFRILSGDIEDSAKGAATYQELLGQERNEALLRFVSPTTFRRRGIAVPIPEPELVYGSLWQRWKAFSQIDIPEEIYDQMCSSLAVSALDVHTRAWKYPRYVLVGFVGLVKFELVRPVNSDVRRLFSALSRLAGFTGVGYRTTMGMGQCRLIDQQLPDESEVDLEDDQRRDDDI